MAREDETRRPREQARSLRGQVAAEVSSAQKLMAAMRRELDEYRKQNAELRAEQSRLRRQALKTDVARIEGAEMANQWQASLRARAELEESLRQLVGDNERLADICEQLEQELIEERELRAACQLELGYAQAQLAELQGMLDLLAGDDNES